MSMRKYTFMVLLFSCLITGCSSDMPRVDINEELNKEVQVDQSLGDPGEDCDDEFLCEPADITIKMDDKFDYDGENICIYKEPYVNVYYNKTVLGISEFRVQTSAIYGNLSLTCVFSDDSGTNTIFTNALNPFNICWSIDRGNKIIKELHVSIEPLELGDTEIDFVVLGDTKAEHLKFISGNIIKFKDEGDYTFYDKDGVLLDTHYGKKGEEYVTQSDVSQYAYLGGE